MIKETTPSAAPEFPEFTGPLPPALNDHRRAIHDYIFPIATLQKSVPEDIKTSGDTRLTESLEIISRFLSLSVLEDNFVDKEKEERKYRKEHMKENARDEWEKNMLRGNKVSSAYSAVDHLVKGRLKIGQHIKTRENEYIHARNEQYLKELREAFWHDPAKTIKQKREFDAKKKVFVQEYSKFIAEVFDAAVTAFRHERQ